MNQYTNYFIEKYIVKIEIKKNNNRFNGWWAKKVERVKTTIISDFL